MEINSIEDLKKRVIEINRNLDINRQAVFNDYIPLESIIELIEHQKEIDKIKVAKENFFTGGEAGEHPIVSITHDQEDAIFFIMAAKKSFSSPFHKLWFGKKTEAYTDYLYCYPLNYGETVLTRTDKDQTITIIIRKANNEKLGCIVKGSIYESQTQEFRKLDENSINKIAMNIFYNAVVSMNTFCDIAREYQAQQQDGSR